MKSVKLAWILAAVSAVALGMGAEACSSSSTTGGGGGGGGGGTSGTGTGEPGTGTGASSGTGSQGTGTGVGTGSGTSGTDSGITCHEIATEVFAEDAGGGHMYCPFSAPAGDGGKDIYCTSGQQCCVPPEGTVSTCQPIAVTCPNAAKSVDWQCEGTPDCNGSAGTICCGQGSLEKQGAQPGCAKDGGTLPASEYVSGFYGSACQASCSKFGSGTGADPSFQICSKNSECLTGNVCLPIKIKGNSVGYCTAGDAGAAGAL